MAVAKASKGRIIAAQNCGRFKQKKLLYLNTDLKLSIDELTYFDVLNLQKTNAPTIFKTGVFFSREQP
jgi:hypothetical protein